ncbi:MAG: hypothetical protein QG635_2065, partial [Bacteroidota bacterium]|nr:hypothetical protein [Bacteroidota bacterium]
MGIAAINPYSNTFVNGSYDQLQQTERAATKTKTAAEKSNTASAVQLQ